MPFFQTVKALLVESGPGKKVSALPVATFTADASLLSTVQGGVNNRITYANLVANLGTGVDGLRLGSGAGAANTTGNRNTALGVISGNTITIGSDNTTLGYDSQTGSVSAAFRTVIGSGALGTADNQVMLGRSADTVVHPGPTTLSGNTTISEGMDVVLGTVTGTMFGTATTQKLGFFNTTPVVQEAGSNDVLASLVTLGLRAASVNPPLNLGTGAVTAGTGSFTTLSASIAVLTAAGTAAAPSHSFTVDTDTGIYQSAADTVGVTAGGVLRLSISAAAVTSLLPVLHPTGSAVLPSITFSGDTNTGIFAVGGFGDILGFATAGLERGRFDSSGNFAVGTTAATEEFQFTRSQNAITMLLVQNATSGAAATCDIRCQNSGGFRTGIGIYSATTTALGALVANGGYLYSFAPAGLTIMSDDVTGGVLKFASGGTAEKARFDITGSFGLGTTSPVAGSGLTIAPAARTSGTPSLLTVTGPADTTLTASTEANDVNFNLARTIQFATGAIVTQRAVRIQAPTYAFVGASTITTAATLAISGAPVAGTNATLTAAYALWVQAGLAELDGGFTSKADSIVNSSSTSAFAVTPGGVGATLSVDTTNVRVGIGTTGPSSTLRIAQPVITSGSPSIVSITGGAHTTLAASTEAIDLKFNLSHTVQFSTGALATQRAALFQAPTYAFVGASTLTDAATLAVTGAPIAGTNATITNAYALWIQAGLTKLDGGLSISGAAGNVLSGTYTPTLTNVANLDASTAYACQYMRVGNTVTVSGKVDVDPTLTATSTQLGISLPIASALTVEEQCGGTANAKAIGGQSAAILADAANDRAQMEWIATDVTNQSMYFSFTYQIL